MDRSPEYFIAYLERVNAHNAASIWRDNSTLLWISLIAFWIIGSFYR